MSDLTAGQLAILAIDVIGPGPGWNANLEVRLPSGVVSGAEISDLFERGLMTAATIAPPYDEDFDEKAGWIILDHLWTATPAGHDARLLATAASHAHARQLTAARTK